MLPAIKLGKEIKKCLEIYSNPLQEKPKVQVKSVNGHAMDFNTASLHILSVDSILSKEFLIGRTYFSTFIPNTENNFLFDRAKTPQIDDH